MRFLRYILLMVAGICAGLSSRAQINTDRVMSVGQNALYFEDYMLSIQYFNLVISAKPYLAKPYLLRAVAKLNLDDYAGAEEDASKALELNPFLTDAYEVRGVALQNRGRNLEAIADYNEALRQLPDNRGLLFNKALAQEESGDLQGALATLSRIVEVNPGYDNGYMGRAKVYLSLADTVAAKADLDKALSLNPNAANAYILRADIAMHSGPDYQAAHDDLSEAIRLMPRQAGLFVNRAFLRYNLDDYFGAMADYDYAITLDPLNAVAWFNRGLMRAELNDNDRAISDFTHVLELDPDDARALFNRALLYERTADYRAALADIDRVVKMLPDYSAPLFARFDIYEKMGDRRHAMADYDKALALSQTEIERYDAAVRASGDGGASAGASAADDTPQEQSERLFAARFSTLLTIDNQTTDERQYNNKNIRGRVQDRDVVIDIEPDFVASYFTSPTELSPSTYFMPDVERVNATRMLPAVLTITNAVPAIDDPEELQSQFAAVEAYNAAIAASSMGGTVRPIDLLGRAMALFTLRDYSAAADDFGAVAEAVPDMALPLLMRAVCRQRLLTQVAPDEAPKTPQERQASFRLILDDYEEASTRQPASPFPHFNKGNLYVALGDLTSALVAYTRAIELKEDFGEAYYNRGYVYFRLGNREAGTADLSRAGQLGILPSYNLLKRMTR